MRWTKAAATAVLLVLATACGGEEPGTAAPATAVTSADADPSSAEPSSDEIDVDGIEIVDYPGGQHVTAPQRVAYDKLPPFGGAHDAIWAACNGVVYEQPVRNEHMVHSLEHGAVWISYDPERVTGEALAQLAASVEGEPYLMLSPYPGQQSPVSMQSWGHRLALDDPTDPRVRQFIAQLRANPATHPEPGATCDVPVSAFDPANPPPLDPSPPGPDAAPVG